MYTRTPTVLSQLWALVGMFFAHSGCVVLLALSLSLCCSQEVFGRLELRAAVWRCISEALSVSSNRDAGIGHTGIQLADTILFPKPQMDVGTLLVFEVNSRPSQYLFA